MFYHDPIYGTQRIDEPLLLELMKSRAMQRLHGVLQHGITALIGVTQPTTRFEHSVGVMLLVKRFGAPLKEQAAALLHDVSHTAFSHVIDYVFGGHTSQGYHEEKKAEVMGASDLPAMLERYGFHWREFLDEAEFPLLEQPSPALCADRLDYFLRDSYGLGLSTLEEIRSALAHLVVHQNRIVADELEAARWLGYTYIATDQGSWSNFREVGLYELAAIAIRRGLALGVISEEDLWSGDQQVWEKLQACPDPVLQEQMARVSPSTHFEWDDANPTFRVSTKLRTIDPGVLVGDRVQALSALDADFARYRVDYLEKKRGLWPVKVIP